MSASAAPASSAELQIDLHDDRLSLRTDALPLEDVLSRIGNRAGIAVTIAGDLGGVRPQQFDDVPLAAAIRRLVGQRHGLLMIYHPADDDGAGRLQEIRIYADLAGLAVAAPAPPAAPEPLAERAVRMAEVRDLMRQGGAEAVRGLARHLATDPDPDVRRVAAAGLTLVGGVTSAKALERALRDADPVVRLQAARSLRTVGGADAAQALSRLARRDADAEARQTAVHLLNRLDHPEVADALQDALADPAASVREAAAQVLAQR